MNASPDASEVADRPARFRARTGRWLALGAAAAFIALLAYGLTATEAETTVDDSLAQGIAPEAPTFSLPVLTGGSGGRDAHSTEIERAALRDGQLESSELRGVPYVLNFWASWCDPCRTEAPVLEQGWSRFGPQGVVFVGLNMQDLSDDAKAFVSEYEIGFPTIRDPSSAVADDFGAVGIPETYFVEKHGRVTAHTIGALTPSDLADGVRSAQTGHVLGVEQGGAIRR
ncbi:MAG: TlpA family protein disulfide reductase [Thermomicrobiales bacterium]|nr:TlpA family protein disulfide reductase [Thermomicrobiales bacterium]